MSNTLRLNIMEVGQHPICRGTSIVWRHIVPKAIVYLHVSASECRNHQLSVAPKHHATTPRNVESIHRPVPDDSAYRAGSALTPLVTLRRSIAQRRATLRSRPLFGQGQDGFLCISQELLAGCTLVIGRTGGKRRGSEGKVFVERSNKVAENLYLNLKENGSMVSVV